MMEGTVLRTEGPRTSLRLYCDLPFLDKLLRIRCKREKELAYLQAPFVDNMLMRFSYLRVFALRHQRR